MNESELQSMWTVATVSISCIVNASLGRSWAGELSTRQELNSQINGGLWTQVPREVAGAIPSVPPYPF